MSRVLLPFETKEALQPLATPELKPVARRPAWQQTRRGAALAQGGALLSRLLGPRGATGFGVLMYHRVTPPIAGVPEATWNVTPQRLEEQLQGLVARGYQPWPLRKVLEHHRDRRTIPRKTFVVTFDDGYESVFHHAWPILRRLHIPATAFLATGYLDSSSALPFDDWLAAGSDEAPPETWRAMTTDQCRQLSRSGLIELGAHTHSHDDFAGRPQELREDLAKCLAVLSERLGIDRPTFAYPFGSTGQAANTADRGQTLSRVAREMGLLCGLTTSEGVNQPQSDCFLWHRFAAEQFDTAATLAAKLDGWYCALKRLRRLGRPSIS